MAEAIVLASELVAANYADIIDGGALLVIPAVVGASLARRLAPLARRLAPRMRARRPTKESRKRDRKRRLAKPTMKDSAPVSPWCARNRSSGETDGQLRRVQHVTVVIARRPFQQRFDASLQTPVKDLAPVGYHLDRLVEIEFVG